MALRCIFGDFAQVPVAASAAARIPPPTPLPHADQSAAPKSSPSSSKPVPHENALKDSMSDDELGGAMDAAGPSRGTNPSCQEDKDVVPSWGASLAHVRKVSPRVFLLPAVSQALPILEACSRQSCEDVSV